MTRPPWSFRRFAFPAEDVLTFVLSEGKRCIKLVARGEGAGEPNSVPPPSRLGQFHRSELESNATRRSRCIRCHLGIGRTHIGVDTDVSLDAGNPALTRAN